MHYGSKGLGGYTPQGGGGSGGGGGGGQPGTGTAGVGGSGLRAPIWRGLYAGRGLGSMYRPAISPTSAATTTTTARPAVSSATRGYGPGDIVTQLPATHAGAKTPPGFPRAATYTTKAVSGAPRGGEFGGAPFTSPLDNGMGAYTDIRHHGILHPGFAAPPDNGMGGFWDRIKRAVTPPGAAGRFVRKTVRYAGAAHVAPFVPARYTQKAFGLSPREAVQFERIAKGARAAAAVAVTAGAARVAMSPSLTAQQAASAKTSGIIIGQTPTYGARFGAGAGRTFGRSILGAGRVAGRAVLVTEATAGLLGRGKRAAVGIYEAFGAGYRQATGKAPPKIPTDRIIEMVRGRRNDAQYIPAPAGTEAIYGPPTVRAGATNWLMLGLIATAVVASIPRRKSA